MKKADLRPDATPSPQNAIARAFGLLAVLAGILPTFIVASTTYFAIFEPEINGPNQPSAIYLAIWAFVGLSAISGGAVTMSGRLMIGVPLIACSFAIATIVVLSFLLTASYTGP